MFEDAKEYIKKLYLEIRFKIFENFANINKYFLFLYQSIYFTLQSEFISKDF